MLNSNNNTHGRSNGPLNAKQKTAARRQQLKEDQKRSDLLAKILEESSSITLNDPTNQLSARKAVENHSRLFDLIDELREIESKLNPKLPTRDEKSWAQFIEWVSAREQSQSPGNQDVQDGLVTAHNTTRQVRLFDRVGIKPQQSGLFSSAASAISNGNKDNTTTPTTTTIEYALVAKVPFKKGEKVFEIDRSLMLTTETALKDTDLCDFVRKDSIASGMQNVVLVLHLLNEFSKGEQSHWWPYLSILPNKILPILHMNKEQITDYLMASAHLHTALKMLRAIIRQYSYFYKRLQSTRLPLRHNFTFLFYTWGVSMVCSRQNEIPHSRYRHRARHHHQNKQNHNSTHTNSNNQQQHQQQQNNNDDDEDDADESCQQQQQSPASVHALIPVLDMCNHDRHSNQATFENDTSCLVAAQDLLPNQEITLNYGCRSSGDFYIHNGFVPDEVAFDMIGLTISLNQKQDPLFEQKAKILKTLNMPTTFGEFTLRSNDYENRHRRDPHLTMFLIVNFLKQEEIDYMMNSDNPVGVADEIYDYVQYGSCNLVKQARDGVTSPPSAPLNKVEGASEENVKADATNNGSLCSANGDADIGEGGPVDKMKKRILNCLREYLSKRASISIALLERTLKTLEERLKSGEADEICLFTVKLLQHERRIYESHVLK